MRTKFAAGLWLVLVAGIATAQQAEKPVPTRQVDPAKFAEMKKKILDKADERIGQLEELEECVQAAQDMQALLACRPQHAAGNGLNTN